MNSLKSVIAVILILTALCSYKMILDYDQLDAFNHAAGRFQWISSLGDDAYHVRRLGNEGQYVVAVSTDDGEGVVDRNGREILPFEYKSVEYHGGTYMAAATTSEYKLFDLKGKEAASFNRISLPYAFAGDRYFIQYGDDHIAHWQDGFQILDAVSGEPIAAYDDCYNAVWLDDGNWYISRTPDIHGAAMRWILLEAYGLLREDPPERETEPPEGFFVNESFEELFPGKAYRLICQGDGLYVAAVMQKGGGVEDEPDADAEGVAGEGEPDADAEDTAQTPIVVLGETGELFQVTDEAALKRIKIYERNGDLVGDTTTIFKGENGLIGLAPLDQTNQVIYMDEAGSRVQEEETAGYAAAQYGGNQGLQLFHEKKEEEGYGQTLYGIMDPFGQIMIPPLFEEIFFLPDTENILVNGNLGCGIIRLEVEP